MSFEYGESWTSGGDEMHENAGSITIFKWIRRKLGSVVVQYAAVDEVVIASHAELIRTIAMNCKHHAEIVLRLIRLDDGLTRRKIHLVVRHDIVVVIVLLLHGRIVKEIMWT